MLDSPRAENEYNWIFFYLTFKYARTFIKINLNKIFLIFANHEIHSKRKNNETLE